MIVERLKLQDASIAQQLILELTGQWVVYPSFIRYCLTSDGDAFAATVDGGSTIAGLILGKHRGAFDTSSIDCIVVRPEFQRHGVGTGLLRAFIASTPQLTRDCRLDVLATNRTAHELYLREGFRDVSLGDKECIYGDLIHMEKSLETTNMCFDNSLSLEPFQASQQVTESS